ncbi:MAG: ATP-binding protein [Spirochaetales bacterium]|uniref:ATP-binding protein n=1 Tax=Candidatus Thalassospirochaeta sargassi TaxID=3119039 RepID=A0AAJ1IGS5_9SPIO|nr:ATP-binding protein [Spirochaetales bacterium]
MALFSKKFDIDSNDPMAYGQASSNFKKTLKQLGIPSPIIKRTAIAMYEAEINTIIHGGGGSGSVVIEDDHILIIFEDQGPGIPDIELAMQEGYSTASSEIREMGFGAGLGLPNIKKNSNGLDIESEPGKGTKVTIRIDL